MGVGGFAKFKKKCEDPGCDDPACDLDMDELMDPCCAKDKKDRRRAARLYAELNEWDPARRALDERRGVFDAAPLFVTAPEGPLPKPSRAADAPRRSGRNGGGGGGGDDDDESAEEEDDEAEEEEEEEEEDSDAEFLDDLDDSELMERMRTAKLREAEADLLSRVVSSAQLRALVASRRAVVVHAFAPGSRAGKHLDGALGAVGARRPGLLTCRTPNGAALDDDLLRSGRVARDRVARSSTGALLVVVDGALAAVALDISQFADDDRAAADVVERWLDHAKAWIDVADGGDAAGDDHDHDDEEEDYEGLDAADARPFYDCGKPGCQRHFEHTHIGLQTPDAWNVDKAAP